jgi:hypothetical protein
MIGNDVVDLDDPESRSAARHARFDARAFTVAEQTMLRTSADGERLRWVLWAAKESAYKAARRDDARVTFAPARVAVVPDRDATASVADPRHPDPALCYTVSVGDRRYRVLVRVGAGYAHAIACAVDACVGMLWSAIARVPDAATASLVRDAATASPGALVRRLAIALLAGALREPPAALAIVRVGRMPVLTVRGRPAPLTLSLSHHGCYVACACAAPARGGVG